MPIPVRCPSCEKGLGIPDKYAGKKVKCPKCQSPIKVPAGEAVAAGASSKSATAKPAASTKPAAAAKPAAQKAAAKQPPAAKRRKVAPPPKSDSDFLADLDLDRLDSRSGELTICPKCTTSLDDLSTICPNCGYDIATGQKDQKFLRKKANKGPDSSDFYKSALRDAKEFTFGNALLIRKTATVWTIFGVLAAVSFRFLQYVQGLPTYVFWACMTALSIFALAGWFWTLGAEIVKLTMAREKAADRLHVDFFATLSIGIRAVLWPFIMGLPLWIVYGAIVFLAGLETSTAVTGAVALYAALYLLFPIAQVHRVQNYTYKSSIFWELIRLVPANIGPLAFYLGVAALLVAPFAGIAYAIDTYAGGISPIANEYIRSASTWVATQVGGFVDSKPGEFLHTSIRRITTLLLAFPAVALFMIPASIPAVMLMRMNGYFGLTNHRALDLVGKILPGTPATFWVRVLAFCVDLFAIPFTTFIVVKEKLASVVAGLFIGVMIALKATAGNGGVVTAAPLWLVYNMWMYFAVSESTTARATIGKETYGLIVIPDAKEGAEQGDFGLMSLQQATKRFAIALFVGWWGLLLIPFDEDGKSLADKLTGTRVVFKGDR